MHTVKLWGHIRRGQNTHCSQGNALCHIQCGTVPVPHVLGSSQLTTAPSSLHITYFHFQIKHKNKNVQTFGIYFLIGLLSLQIVGGCRHLARNNMKHTSQIHHIPWECTVDFHRNGSPNGHSLGIHSLRGVGIPGDDYSWSLGNRHLGTENHKRCKSCST